ncbi:hypothetical protein PABG_11311 [Paracoccidioides brasiliensis Pb03]|nr:hypothetical protein PABG_11311 [Paracoccidioides brasiliensis Pb03]
MTSTISEQPYQHILSPIPTKPKSGLVNDPTATFSAATFSQEISRAMQASSSQLPKYVSYSYMEDAFDQPPPPPPSPVGWAKS